MYMYVFCRLFFIREFQIRPLERPFGTAGEPQVRRRSLAARSQFTRSACHMQGPPAAPPHTLSQVNYVAYVDRAAS